MTSRFTSTRDLNNSFSPVKSILYRVYTIDISYIYGVTYPASIEVRAKLYHSQIYDKQLLGNIGDKNHKTHYIMLNVFVPVCIDWNESYEFRL